MNTQQRRSNRSRKPGKQARKTLSRVPPQFDAAIIVPHKFRFQASAAMAATTITTQSFISLLVMAVTTTTTQAIFTAVKLSRISMWGPPAADLVPVTVSVEFASGSGASNTGVRPLVYSDTSVGSTAVAHVTTRPPQSAASSKWQISNAAGVTDGLSVILSGPAGTIIDVEAVFVIQNGEPALAGSAGTGLTVGNVMCMPLDGFVANVIRPISYRPLT